MKAPDKLIELVARESKIPKKGTVLLYSPEGKSNIEITKFLKEERGFICGTYKKMGAWCYKNLLNRYDMVIVPNAFLEPGSHQALYDNIKGLVKDGGELFIASKGDLNITTALGTRSKVYGDTKGNTTHMFYDVRINTNNEEVPMSSNARLTADEKEKIIKLYNKGLMDVEAVAKYLGRSYSVVVKVLKARGVYVSARTCNRVSEGDKNLIIQKSVFQGKPRQEIADEMGIPYQTVSNILRKRAATHPDTLRIHVPGYPPVDVINTVSAAEILKGRGITVTFGALLKSVKSGRGVSMDKFGFWVEKLPLNTDTTKEPDTMPDIEQLLDESPCSLGDGQKSLSAVLGECDAIQEILTKYPMPLDLIEKVLKEYYEGTYLPEQKRQEALKNIQDIMSSAGLTSEDILNIL